MKTINKLNEDFFDDLDDNDLIDEPVNEPDDFFNEPFDDTDYTYDIQFIIYMYPFIKDLFEKDPVYYFEDPNYEHKETMKSGFLSMIKVLDYILQATPIVTDYSKPKFCSSYEKIIKAFPFMNNKPSNEFDTLLDEGNFIILETSINLSGRKNEHNLLKMFYSFWKLEQIYIKLITTIYPNIDITRIEHVQIALYKNNSYRRFPLIHSGEEPNSYLLRSFYKFFEC